MGTKPVVARFSLLPETKPRMSALGTSVIVQICLVAFLVSLPLFFPQELIPKTMYMVTDIAGPPLDIPEPPKPKPPAPPKVAKVQPPPPVEKPAPKPDMAKLFAPRIEAPKPKPRQVAADLPKVNDTFQPLNLKVETSQPARPKEPVKTGLMSGGSSAVPTIASRPVEKVQTGGFGDPNGVAGPSNPNKRANVGQFGNAALPPGPGYGNGSGGANGARGIIASTGFGNGVAVPPTGPKRTGAVQTAGFSNSNDQVVEAPKKKVEEGPAIEPVVILAKPKPVYTAEAIKLNLEGEVLLDVVFPASGGEVQVNRVVKGLGHGLDEAAIRAAQQIKYKPAISGGHPVDFPAVVHIVFQIAF
ncbi:MAG TPA: energy transducer TonB [Candidatus Acidoferrales bacterium]|nr:energy transducer TonB [Candidatus Acidoferrales bacterium]